MPVTRTSPRFVGREDELVRVGAALDRAAAGEPAALLVAASAGLGATRLLGETVRRLRDLDSDFLVLRGRAYPARAAEPYAALAAALDALPAAVTDADLPRLAGPAPDTLARLVPALRPRLERLGLLAGPLPVAAPERRQARLFEAVLGALGVIGERRPVVLMLEDLQGADVATRAAITFLARTMRSQRLCVIATYQPDELTREHLLHANLVAMAEAPRGVARLELGPLGRDDLAALIAGIEGGRPSASLLLLVAERSRGNPLVAEEILAARHELSGTSLTGALGQLVMARVALRSPECRRVLRLLAAAGEPLTHAELAAAAQAFELQASARPPRSSSAPRRAHGPLDADLTAGLEEAIEHGFVVEEDLGVHAARRLAVRHELIARAIRADLLAPTRRRYSRALAEMRAATPSIAVGHWAAAREAGAARAAALAAAEAAEALDAFDVALPHYELALELSDAVQDAAPVPGAPAPGGPGLAGLEARAAEAAFLAGDERRAAAYAEAAIAGLDERRDRVALGLLWERLGRFRRAGSDYHGAVAAHQRAVDVTPRQPSRERALVLAGLAQIRMIEGSFVEARRLAQQAIAVAREVGAPARAELVHATTTLAVVDAWGDDPQAALGCLEEARAMAAEAGLLDDLFRAYANLTTVLDLLGRREEAVAVAAAGVAETERVGQAAAYGNFLRGNAAESLYRLGRWDEARTMSLRALEWAPAGIAFLNPLLTLAMVEIETTAGEFAGRLLGRLLLETETVPDSQNSARSYAAAASYALWRDDLIDASRAIARGWARVRATEDWVLIAELAATGLEVEAMVARDARFRRDLATLAGARGRADAMLGEATRALEAAGVRPEAGSRREPDAMLATARAYRAALDRRDRPRLWADVAACWDELGDPYRAARARRREAEAALTGRGGLAGRAMARAPLTAAAESAATLGARPLLRALAELARR
ncbi:MAG TPA: AAA family ATPase, partial [Candidatus Limnocylindrales bacterium]